MELRSFVARVAYLDSPECNYGLAGHRPGPGAVLLDVLTGLNHDVLTFRYTNEGKGVGEVWFPNEAEARAGIAAEFPVGLGPWERVPAGVKDPHEYAIGYAQLGPLRLKPNDR